MIGLSPWFNRAAQPFWIFTLLWWLSPFGAKEIFVLFFPKLIEVPDPAVQIDVPITHAFPRIVVTSEIGIHFCNAINGLSRPEVYRRGSVKLLTSASGVICGKCCAVGEHQAKTSSRLVGRALSGVLKGDCSFD